jgi:hypothetical protein
MRSINILLKTIGTSRKRQSKVNKIPSKRLKQSKYVFLRLITKLHQPCERIENKRSRKPKGHSRMNNPQRLITLGTQDSRRRQAKQTTQHNMC